MSIRKFVLEGNSTLFSFTLMLFAASEAPTVFHDLSQRQVWQMKGFAARANAFKPSSADWQFLP